VAPGKSVKRLKSWGDPDLWNLWITSAGTSDRWNMVELMDLTAGIVSGFAQSELAMAAHQCFYMFDGDESVSHAVIASIQAMSDFLSFRYSALKKLHDPDALV
jgi:hypothetical protein